MAKRTAKADAGKSAVCASIEHVFAQQKDRLKLFIRSIGAEATIVMATIACNLGRWRWWERRAATA